MLIELTIMSGAGNIFTVIDNRQNNLPQSILEKAAPELCHLNNMKTEGLLTLEKNDDPNLDFQALFFNPDGSSGMMCGNGGRCIINYSHIKNEVKLDIDLVQFSMAGKLYKGRLLSDNIQLFLPPPEKIDTGVFIEVNSKRIELTYVNVGSDHCVINVSELDGAELYDLPIDKIAPPIRHHEYFSPRGVNVNIYTQDDINSLHLRTFERGVEAETGACGTGAVSTALASVLRGETRFPVNIIPTSGIPLKIDIAGEISAPEYLILEGPAEVIEIINYDLKIL